jgi:protease secretion system membrane fusion protein
MTTSNTLLRDAPPVNTDARTHTRLGWWLVLGGLGTFLVWALLAPLDQGVPIPGTITVTGNRKAVQHATGGTIESILVREGDRVSAGQTLVQMNSVQARTSAQITRVQLLAARSTEARLLAERDGLADIAFPAGDATSLDPAQIAQSRSSQAMLFSSRQNALRSEIAAMSESIAGLQALASALQQSRDSRQEQLAMLKEQLDNLRELASEGFVPRHRVLEIERSHAQLRAAIADDSGNLARSQRQIAELRLRQLQSQQDYQKEVRTTLADVQREAVALAHRLEALEYELTNVQVKASVDGVVAELNVSTEGGVVGPGFRMMDILPSAEPLIVEGQVPVDMVDQIQVQMPVELILAAYNQNTTPRVPGVVTHVSPDRMTDEKTGQPYYRLRAAVTPQGLPLLQRLKVQPGMPVEVFVKTGERTLANYLIRPLRDNLRLSLTEE